MLRALEAAKSLEIDKIRDAERVMIEEVLTDLTTLDIEPIQIVNRVLRMYKQTGKYGEMVRLIRMITENFPECSAFRALECEALIELGGLGNANDALSNAVSLCIAEPNSMKAKLLQGQAHVALMAQALETLDEHRDVVISDPIQRDAKQKCLDTFEKHAVEATNCMEDVYHMESAFDVESPPTLAAGTLACAMFCRVLVLEEKAVLATAAQSDAAEMGSTDGLAAVEAAAEETAQAMVVIKAKIEQLIMQLNMSIGGYSAMGATSSASLQVTPDDTVFDDAVCLFEVNLVGIHLFKEQALYNYVNKAAEKIYEQGSNDVQLMTLVRTLKMISRVQVRRNLVEASANPNSIPAQDESSESHSNQKDRFTFWCRFLASPNDTWASQAVAFKTGAKVPVLLVQEDQEAVVPCYVSIELSLSQGDLFNSSSANSSLDTSSGDLVTSADATVNLTQSPGGSSSEARRESRGNPSSTAFSMVNAWTRKSSRSNSHDDATPSFVQIVQAFGDAKYILPIVAGEFKLQDMDIPLGGNTHGRRQGRQEVDRRQLILSKSVIDDAGINTQVCTLMFCSPTLRTGFREWCGEHGFENTTAQMEAMDGRTKKAWLFDYDADGMHRVMIGRGSFARVFRGKMQRDDNSKLPIAIKELIQYEVPSVRQSFDSEIRMLGELNHENIIKSYGWDDTKTEAPCLLLQLVQGGNLQDLVKLYGPVWEPKRHKESESLIAWYAVQLCRAVEYLHGKQIMSRDIKDENCMVNQVDGSLVLIDFGTHKDMSEIQPVTASFAGTPMTMSGTRLTNKPYGIEEDIYSVGETIRGLCGASSFRGNLTDFKMYRAASSSVSVGADWPPAIQSFLKQCFASAKVRSTASELLSNAELFSTERLRLFDPMAHRADPRPDTVDTASTGPDAVEKGTLFPPRANSGNNRLASAWSQMKPQKKVIKEFVELLAEEEGKVCDMWWNSLGRGLQAVTPRVIPGASKPESNTPSYFKVLLKILKKLLESKILTKVAPWATQQLGKILASQECSQFELDQTFRVFAFKDEDLGGSLRTTSGSYAHFLIPMLRMSPTFNAHQVFLVKEMCDEAVGKAIKCLKDATQEFILSAKPLATPAIFHNESLRKGASLHGVASVPGVPRESSLGNRRPNAPSKLGLTIGSVGHNGGGRPQLATPMYSSSTPVTPASAGIRPPAAHVANNSGMDVGPLLERMIETERLLAHIVEGLVGEKGPPTIPTPLGSGKPATGDSSHKMSLDGEGRFLTSFIVGELQLPAECVALLMKEQVTLKILDEDMERDDLIAVGLPVGPRAKIWKAVCARREQGVPGMPLDVDAAFLGDTDAQGTDRLDSEQMLEFRSNRASVGAPSKIQKKTMPTMQLNISDFAEGAASTSTDPIRRHSSIDHNADDFETIMEHRLTQPADELDVSISAVTSELNSENITKIDSGLFSGSLVVADDTSSNGSTGMLRLSSDGPWQPDPQPTGPTRLSGLDGMDVESTEPVGGWMGGNSLTALAPPVPAAAVEEDLSHANQPHSTKFSFNLVIEEAAEQSPLPKSPSLASPRGTTRQITGEKFSFDV
jgi:serine/threonine protein kinase